MWYVFFLEFYSNILNIDVKFYDVCDLDIEIMDDGILVNKIYFN